MYHGLALVFFLVFLLLLKCNPSLGEADAREVMGTDFGDYITTFIVLRRICIECCMKTILNRGLMDICLVYPGHSNSGPYSPLCIKFNLNYSIWA